MGGGDLGDRLLSAQEFLDDWALKAAVQRLLMAAIHFIAARFSV
jgi:hypothetical protein